MSSPPALQLLHAPRCPRRRCRFLTKVGGGLTILLVVAQLAAGTGVAQTVADPTAEQAAFLYRVLGFVEWPPHTLAGQTTLDICVLEPSPFGRILPDLLEGETVRGLRLAYRLVNERDVNACHVLFLPATADARTAVLRTVADRPVLTVSDADMFLDEGGVIQLRVVRNRVRFDISARAAARAGIRLSAQLLRLAGMVEGQL